MDEIARKYGGVQNMELFFSLVVWTCFLALTALVALAVAGKVELTRCLLMEQGVWS